MFPSKFYSEPCMLERQIFKWNIETLILKKREQEKKEEKR